MTLVEACLPVAEASMCVRWCLGLRAGYDHVPLSRFGKESVVASER